MCCSSCCKVLDTLYNAIQQTLNNFYQQVGNPDKTGKSPTHLVYKIIDSYRKQYNGKELKIENENMFVLRHIVLDINGCSLNIKWKYWDRTKTFEPIKQDGNEITLWCEDCNCKKIIGFIGD